MHTVSHERWMKRHKSITTERKWNWSTDCCEHVTGMISICKRISSLILRRNRGKIINMPFFSSGKHGKINNVENKTMIVLALPGCLLKSTTCGSDVLQHDTNTLTQGPPLGHQDRNRRALCGGKRTSLSRKWRRGTELRLKRRELRNNILSTNWI